MHLEQILRTTRVTVAARKLQLCLEDLERVAAERAPRGFVRSLRSRSEHSPAIIAELKKALKFTGLLIYLNERLCCSYCCI